MNKQSLLPQTINAAVFCYKDQWAHLICSCLTPFLKEKKVKNYCLYFFEEQGDQVRVIIDDCSPGSEFKKAFSCHVDRYLNTNSFVAREIKYPLAYFFEDFDNNTIYYDLFRGYARETNLIDAIVLAKLKSEVTRLIVSHLSLSTIDEESIFTFAMYLQLAIVRAFCADIHKARVLLKGIINNLNNNIPQQLQVNIEIHANAAIKENLEELIATTGELWPVVRILWLEKWIKLCDGLKQEGNEQQLFLHVSSQIFEQLGLREPNVLTLSIYMLYNLVINNNYKP